MRLEHFAAGNAFGWGRIAYTPWCRIRLALVCNLQRLQVCCSIFLVQLQDIRLPASQLAHIANNWKTTTKTTTTTTATKHKHRRSCVWLPTWQQRRILSVCVCVCVCEECERLVSSWPLATDGRWAPLGTLIMILIADAYKHILSFFFVFLLTSCPVWQRHQLLLRLIVYWPKALGSGNRFPIIMIMIISIFYTQTYLCNDALIGSTLTKRIRWPSSTTCKIYWPIFRQISIFIFYFFLFFIFFFVFLAARRFGSS